MSVIKSALIRSTAINIKDYIDRKHALDVDVYDLMEIINDDVGFLVDAMDRQIQYFNSITLEDD